MPFGRLHEKVIVQCRNILPPLTQGRQLDRYHIKPVIEVRAKFLLAGERLEIFLAARDHPAGNRNKLVRTEPLNYPLLKHTQQLYLHDRGHTLDFVEKQGAAGSVLDLSNPPFLRTCKSARLVAKSSLSSRFSGRPPQLSAT